jgi:hypothetical protein
MKERFVSTIDIRGQGDLHFFKTEKVNVCDQIVNFDESKLIYLTLANFFVAFS